MIVLIVNIFWKLGFRVFWFLPFPPIFDFGFRIVQALKSLAS